MTKITLQNQQRHCIEHIHRLIFIQIEIMVRNPEDMKVMAEIMKAMAHSDRLAIVQLLCANQANGLTVKSIYEKLGLQQPVVSRHLNILRNAGVVRRTQEGQKISYCLCTGKRNVKPLLKCFC